ncbi:hypothetical protein Bsub01_01138 [Bacillus subtilis]|nr:hypothetical protein BSNT_09428 [Bacillus subtilis subsp. natto BEST195]BEH06982.1 hypothetical protein BSNN_30150 [Bacillus subtilis subsp. natto]
MALGCRKEAEDNVPVLKTFWQEYKGEFFRSNLLGAVLALIGVIIYIDLAFIYPSHSLLHILRFAIMIFGFLFVSMLFYVFPLLVHFDWKKRLYVKFSLLLSVAYLQYTFAMLALTVALFFLLAYLPDIVPFFSVSLISYCHMRIVYAVLLKVEQQGGEPQRESHIRKAF